VVVGGIAILAVVVGSSGIWSGGGDHEVATVTSTTRSASVPPDPFAASRPAALAPEALSVQPERSVNIVSVPLGAVLFYPWLMRGEIRCEPTFVVTQGYDARIEQVARDCEAGRDAAIRLLCGLERFAVDYTLLSPIGRQRELGAVLRDASRCPGRSGLPPGSAFDPSSGLTIRGLGPLHVGVSLRQVEVSLRVPLRMSVESNVGLSCYFAYPIGIEGVALWVHGEAPASRDPLDGTISAVVLGGWSEGALLPPLRTASGLAIGDPISRVVELYGDRVVPFTDNYGAEHYDLHPRDPVDAAYQLRISIRDGWVTELTAGEKGTVQLEEGCS
jgi:hypothetical protein